MGTCGLLHFLVPVVPLGGEPPDAPVGYRRIIVYNDYMHNGNICSSDVTLDFEPLNVVECVLYVDSAIP